ncbi:hypothetical protein KFK09_018573 [Dendrobium nobile]|uniref:Uncharacterized protein n=1 Tax=Dendrobium nobile TaxID=94219 RepID=A0A8T3AW80_DENNO|nr:hypothetical protein KFK09_018573 [Dendrobium nobile]
MGTLISDGFLVRQSVISLSSRLTSIRYPTFIHSARQRCTWKRKHVNLFCSTFASPDPDFSIYGGWEELELMEEAGDSGLLEPFRRFIIALGFDDKKHALPFLLGFFAALTVSRVRFLTIALLPVSILVFLGGFAIGAAQAGFVDKKMGRNGYGLGVFEEKLKQLEALFSDLDGKMSYLRNGLEGGFNVDELGMGGAETDYLQIVEYVRTAIGEAQKTLTDSFSNDLFEGHIDFDVGAKKLNQKSSRKTVELRASGIDFFQFFAGMLHESVIGSKSKKPKDSINEKLGQQLNPVDAKGPFIVSEREIVAGNEFGESSRGQLRSVNKQSSNVEEYGMPSNDKRGGIERTTPGKDRSNNNLWKNGPTITNDVSILNSVENNFKNGSAGSDMLSFDEEGNNENGSSSSWRFMTNRGSFKKVVFEQNYERGAFNNNLNDSSEGNIFQKRTKNMEYLTRESKSSLHEHTLEIRNRVHEPSCRSESSELQEKQINGFDFEESTSTLRNHPSLGNQRPTNARGECKMPETSNISMDEKFADGIKEASYLLTRAREFMMTQAGEEQADATLYKAADLLSAAIDMRPMSLVAVGQLGNTYLLHGELKLKVTRELRTLLLRSDSLFKKNDSIVTNREEIASVLVSVCEECEVLLVKAGRKYRRALSIDGNDVRALYNWGIALCFRAQLIADVGPEAAMDADKVYLAAIDKFNAMMSGSNAFAPDALYRWGMVLQQRSHLRRNNSREKSKLLHQAKSLFEEVLSMDSDNQVVRHALISCISELNYNQL